MRLNYNIKTVSKSLPVIVQFLILYFILIICYLENWALGLLAGMRDAGIMTLYLFN